MGLFPPLIVLVSSQAIEDAVVDFSKHPKLNDTDSVLVVIMSHGKLGVVVGVGTQSEPFEEDHFSLDKIYEHLGPKGCPALLNKPKIIIIQACRGGDDPLSSPNDAAPNSKNDSLVLQTKEERSF